MSQPTTTTSTSPLYKSHPLYSFRRLLLIDALIGIPLAAISAASAPQYTMGIWIFGCLSLIASDLLALADLIIWVHRKHKEDLARCERDRGICRVCSGPIDGGEDSDGSGAPSSSQTLTNGTVTRRDDGDGNDDDGPKWPVRWIMILDFLLTGILFWMLMYEMAVANDPWYGRYSPGSSLVWCYATVPMGFSVVLHARCWWRQFRAREREAWGRELRLSMGVGGVGRVEDVEAGVEGIDCHHGHSLGSGSEGHYTCGSRNANRTPPVLQKRKSLVGAVEEKVKRLNRETIQALKSKTSLPDRSDPGERQPLLTPSECAHARHTQYTNDGNERCACSRPHTSRLTRSESNAVAHSHDHGPVDRNCNNDVNGDSNDAAEVKPIAIDRTAAYFTPSDSGVTSASSSKVSSSSGSHESYAGKSKKEVDNETDIEDEEVAANSTLLSHGGRPLHVVDMDDDKDDGDDADIMVVKKAKKGKAKAQKQKKGKNREVEFEE